MSEDCDQNLHNFAYIHLKHPLLHGQMGCDLNHEQDLKFQLNPHLILDILQLILLFEQLQLNE